MSKELINDITNLFPAEVKQAKNTGYALLGNDILAFNGKDFSIIRGE